MTNNSLINIRQQQQVAFYDDELTAVRGDDGRVYVSLRHICQALTIDTTGQRQRINRHKVLDKGLRVCKIQTLQGEQQTYVLRVDLVPFWLSGIRTASIEDEAIRAKLDRFQDEAAAVLWEAFQDGRLTTDNDIDELLKQDTPEAQAYLMAQAIMRLARSQLLLKTQVDTNTQRIENIETQLGSGRTITPDQATAVSQAVKAIALELGKKSGRNEFGGVYGELYRRFRIPSYKQLPAAQYDKVMSWLGEWLESLTGEEPF